MSTPRPMIAAEVAASADAARWQAFEREMARQAEDRLVALKLTDPKQVYLMARETIYAVYQERWECTRKQCDPATIFETSVMATHAYLSKRSPYGLLYTLGYAALGASPTIEQLVELGVTIYDIRFSPRSRVHKWRKPNLRDWLGDRYVHLPALGNVYYNQPEQGFLLAEPVVGVPVVAQQLQAGNHVALMCVCKEHEGCHRGEAAEMILAHLPNVILVPLPSFERADA